MRVTNTHVFGIEDAIRASGYPMNLDISYQPISEKDIDRAKRLARNQPGTGHNSFLKGILVTADVTAPQYWWQQWQRYHFHDIISSQSKMLRILKMDIKKQCNEYVHPTILHILQNQINQYNNFDNWKGSLEDTIYGAFIGTKQQLFQSIISNCPMGLNLTAETVTNYLQLKTIYQQRKNHKLEEWHVYCDWIKSLPCAEDFIVGKEVSNDSNSD